MHEFTVLHSVIRWLHVTETWIAEQIRCLPPEVDAQVVARTLANIERFPCLALHALPDEPLLKSAVDLLMRRLGLRRHLAFVAEVLRRTRAQVLHSHFGNLGWENLPVTGNAGVPHVVTFYGYDVNQLPHTQPIWRRRYRELFAEIDRVLCEGEYMARCIANLGCPPEKIIVQRLGVRVDAIPFRPRRWNPAEPLRVLLAAGFREKKGIPCGIEALGKVLDSVSIELTIIGDATPERRAREEKRRILQTIERCGLRSRTRLLGFQPHERLLEEALEHHVFLAPSVTASDGDTEGGAPVILMELAASGMPIVSTHHCDIPNVIVDGVTGLLAPERDSDAIAEHILSLVRHPESWLSMVVAARRRTEIHFDAQVQARRLADIYRELLVGVSACDEAPVVSRALSTVR